MANTFVQLTDTPSVYSGSTGKFVQVSGVDTLIFNNIELNTLTDVQVSGAYEPSTGEVLTFTASGNWRPISNDPYSAGNGLNKTGSTLSVVAGSGLTANASGVFITGISNVAGTYGNVTHVPQITVNDRGQVIAVTEVEGVFTTADSLNASYVGNILGTAGTINVTGGKGINSNATVTLVATGVTAATYGNTTHAPQITVDTYGRITNVDLVEISSNIVSGNGNVDYNQFVTEAYRNIEITGTAGQTALAADLKEDTLTFNAGAGIEITTTASSDTITISATDSVLTSNIGDLSDVDTTGITDGQALIYDGANSVFVASNVSDVDLGTSSIGELSDVITSGIVNGQVLVWDAGNTTFKPGTVSAGGGGDITAVIAGDGLTGGSASGEATLTVGAGTGITVDADSVSLSNTTVTPGTYGNATLSPQITVNAQGQITDVTEVSISGGGGSGGDLTGERFKVNYASDGTLASVSDLTAGITSVNIDSASGGEVTITFNNANYNYPPGGVLMYGYDYTNNVYVVSPLESTMSLRQVAAGGSSGAPTLFDGTGTVELRLRLRETETGASRGFGTITHAWIQFTMNG
jgi:hypothetical protein